MARHLARLLVPVLVALTLQASPAGATPPDVFGFGSRTQAMGMTGVSFAGDYEAVYSNPAGLSRAERNGIHLGMQQGAFRLSLDGVNTPLDPYAGTTIGLQIPLPFGGVLEDTFVIGAGFFTPHGAVLQTDIIFPEIASWALLNRTQSVHLQMGLGINLSRLLPGLRVGVGFAALANIGGRLNVSIDQANQFVSETETQLLASFSPIVGAQYDIGPVSIGFTWHDEVISDIDLNIVTSLPLDLPVITITATPQYDPHLFAAEVAYRPTSEWLIAAQFNARLWSRYEGVVGRSTSNSNLPPAPDFRNTFSPRVGIEYNVTRKRTTGSLRAGYAFEMTPAPPAALRPGRDSEGNVRTENGETVLSPLRYIDNNRHVLTFGGGVHWRAPVGAHVRLDTFIQYHRLTPRTHDISNEGDGQTGAPLESAGNVIAGGWTVSLEW
ncbi:MAG: OmpP1/FadL family transporter [Polyangiales bacterium]